MKYFTKQESKVLLIIFTVLFLVTGYNMLISLRRGRDNIRKDDISAIQKSLERYHEKYKIYPLSNQKGEIIGCFNENPQYDKITGQVGNAVVCKWGESYFENTNLMPRDPKYKKGASYRYISDGKSYSLFISLEGKDEVEYTQSIVNRNLQCGSQICNYGRRN